MQGFLPCAASSYRLCTSRAPPRRTASRNHQRSSLSLLLALSTLSVVSCAGVFSYKRLHDLAHSSRYRWLSDHPKMNALTVHNVAVTIGGVATIAVPFLNSYWMYIVYCVLFGIGTGFLCLNCVLTLSLTFSMLRLTALDYMRRTARP